LEADGAGEIRFRRPNRGIFGSSSDPDIVRRLGKRDAAEHGQGRELQGFFSHGALLLALPKTSRHNAPGLMSRTHQWRART
jgi:hypothetical protein